MKTLHQSHQNSVQPSRTIDEIKFSNAIIVGPSCQVSAFRYKGLGVSLTRNSHFKALPAGSFPSPDDTSQG